MAEIFLKLKATSHSDPDRDREGCYKRGMIVTVQQDGFDWGRLSISFYPAACIIKIPGLAVEKIEDLTSPQMEDDSGISQIDPYRRRQWILNIDDIPNGLKQTVKDTGEITVTVSKVRNYIKRIRDNAQYVGMD